MRIRLQRGPQDPNSTPGRLFIDDVDYGVTLELPVKDGLPGSAIPAGIYPIRLRPSPKFVKSEDPWVQRYAKLMPHIDDIPGRSLIMLHWGNGPGETDGCPLVGGQRIKPDLIARSRIAYTAFYATIFDAAKAEQCDIEVLDAINEKIQGEQNGS